VHRWLPRLAMATGLIGVVLEVRAWRRALLDVGELPTVASRMVARHSGLRPDGSPGELGWPSGVQEDDDVHWSWGRRTRSRG